MSIKRTKQEHNEGNCFAFLECKGRPRAPASLIVPRQSFDYMVSRDCSLKHSPVEPLINISACSVKPSITAESQ